MGRYNPQMETPAVRKILRVVLAAENGITTLEVRQSAGVGMNYLTECLSYLRKAGHIGHYGNSRAARWASPERAVILRAQMVEARKRREYAAKKARLKIIAKEKSEAKQKAAKELEVSRVWCKASQAGRLTITGPRWVFDLGVAA